MSINVHWQEGCQFKVITEDGFALAVDAGSKSAPCPTEILLSALGSCSATDVVLGLKEQGAEVRGLSNRVTYTLTDSEPRLYQSVNLHFMVEGAGITDNQVASIAREAINKHCHVCLMLQPAITISHSVEVIN